MPLFSLYSFYTASIVISIYAIWKYFVYPALLSPLSKIPSASVWAPWTSWWILRKRLVAGENRTVLEAHRSLGGIVRLGPNEVSVNSVEGLKAVYVGNFDKHEWFANAGMVNGISNAFSSLDSKSHSESRKLFTNVYSKSYIHNSPEVKTLFMSLMVDKVMPELQKAASAEHFVDILEFSDAIAYDSTSAFIFGHDLVPDPVQNLKQRKELLQAHEKIRPYFGILGELAHPIRMLEKLGLKPVPNEVYMAFGKCVNHVSDMCREASSSNASKATVYDHVVQNFDKSGITCPKDAKITAELFDQVLAGLLTMSITLSYAIYELSRNVQIQARLRTELLSVDAQDGIPDPRALDSLPLLDATIYESMRKYPPVPTNLPRVVPKSGVQLGGYHIPGGVRISANAYSLHHNEDVFTNADQWKPERWIESNQEHIMEMKRWFWGFGSGARMCLGMHFALLDLKYIIATIYTNFQTSIVEAGDMTQMDGFIGRPIDNRLEIKFENVLHK